MTMADQQTIDDRLQGPFYGEQAEEYVVEYYGIEMYRQDYYDALDGDDPIQIKGTSVEIENPSGTRRGRFRLWDDDHKKLVANGGEYVFVLYDPEGEHSPNGDHQRPVIDTKRIDAKDVTGMVDHVSWTTSDSADAKHRQKQKKPTWTAIFDEDVVE